MCQKYDITLKKKRTRASKRQNIFIQPKSVNHFHLQIYFIYSFVRLFIRSFAWRVCLFSSTAFIVFLFLFYELWHFIKKSLWISLRSNVDHIPNIVAMFMKDTIELCHFMFIKYDGPSYFCCEFSFWLIICRSTRSINVSPLYFFRCNHFDYVVPYSRKSMAKCV